jgi:ABC-type phosphate transport system substrate-binding protein
MRFNLHKVAVAATLAAAGASAFAASNKPITNYNTTTTDIYLTGSSAVDAALVKFIANACDTNTMDAYRSDVGTRTHYLWTCESAGGTSGGTFGLPTTKIAIHKNTGSSAEGTTCFQTGTGAGTSSISSCNTTSFAYLQVSDVSAALAAVDTNANPVCTESTVASSATISAYQQFNCGTWMTPTKVSTNPHFGFSDSEPQQFASIAAPSIPGQLSSASPFTLIFGVPVSLTIRNKMQAVQGLGVGQDDEANMPSITTAQLNGIFTSKYQKWSDAVGLPVAGANSLADDQIYRVRRSNGSGTTRITNEEFIGEFCTPGVSASTAGLGATPGTGANLGTFTIADPVAECVTNNLTNTVFTLSAGTTEDLLRCISTYDTAGVGSIGVASTDFVPGQGVAPAGFRFLKINGFAPSLLNVADGRYTVWSELVINFSKARLGGTGVPTLGADATALAAFYNRFKTASANATFIGELASNLTNVGFQGGLIASAAVAPNPTGWGLAATTGALTVQSGRTPTSMLAYPVNPFTRSQGARWNLCQKPQPQQAGYIAK